MMSTTPRVAQPGDIFILLVPDGADLGRLGQEQDRLQNQYGGQIIAPIHITTQRFSPKNGQITSNCVNALREKLRSFTPLPIMADDLIQFFAPYWQCQVLRWRVQETPAWSSFRSQLESTLTEIGCPSHFSRRRHATCTILKLDHKVVLTSYSEKLPLKLFTAQEVWISTLKNGGEFEIVEKLDLEGQAPRPA